MASSNSPRPPKPTSPDFSPAIIQAGIGVAGSAKARVIFVYASAIEDLPALRRLVPTSTSLIVVCRDTAETQRAEAAGLRTITVPPFDLTRMNQIKMATLMGFTQEVIRGGDVFVFLSGLAGRPIDTMVVMQVGQEYELFQTVGQPRLTEHIRPAVFERVLRLALELANEGREGKPVGSMWVIGDHRTVLRYAREGRINPFRGYAERDRNILDESMVDVVKELAKLDGAYIVKGTGAILSAGTTLHPPALEAPSVERLGSRHAAAAGITALTRSIAITVSESTGVVRVWRRGALITEIERAERSMMSGPPSPFE